MAYIPCNIGGGGSSIDGLTQLGGASSVGTTKKTITFSEPLTNFSYIVIVPSSGILSSTGFWSTNSVTCMMGAERREGFTTTWVSSVSGTGECTLTISDITDTSLKIKADKATSKSFYVLGIK